MFYPSRKRPPWQAGATHWTGTAALCGGRESCQLPCGAELWGTGTAALLPSRGAAACNACNHEVSVVR